MRNLCLTAVLALSFSSALAADTLSIGNYQFIDSQRVTLTKYNVTYSASLINTGGALTAVTATLTTSDPSVQVVPNRDTLNFAPVPANSQVASSNTFTILVDRSVPFDFSKLHWTFNTTGLPPPIANAGSDQNAIVGNTVTLNGSGSTNPSGVGTLTYNFTFMSRPAGSNATITNPTSVMPTFVPDVAGDYIVLLTVNNGTASSTATVKISTTSPVAPIANAGPNQTVNVGSTVTLNGSGSTDAGGKPLTYAFTITSRPANSNATLTNPTSVSPTFTADKPGSYTVQLIVNNGTSNSLPSTVIITTQCPAPVANAGMGSNINVGSVVTLNGANSTDVCGNPLTYQFSLITVPAGSNATLSSATAVNPSFTADKQGTYVAQLIVNNGQTSSAPVTVTFSTNQVLAPTAKLTASPSTAPAINSVVTLDGTGSTDPNNPALPLNYKFSLTTVPNGSTATLTNPNTAKPTFIADKPGTYVAQLIVNNGFVDSAPATLMITVQQPQAPTANPGPNQTVVAPATVNLNGSGSTDPNNLPLTYSFTFTSKPVGSNATLTGATTVAPSFNADIPGTYVVQLIVNNGFQPSNPQTVTITATNGPASTISATSGTPQSATVSATFSAPLVATVLDSHGFPVPGVTVTFTAPPSGASGSFSGSSTTTAVTNASGVATSPTFTANNIPGTYNVVATAPGVAAPVNFALTNTQGTPASIAASSGSGQSAAINTALGAPFVAIVKDSNGNPVSGVTVTFAPPASGPSGTFAGGVNTAVTNASGLATSAVFTTNGTSGAAYNVVASTGGFSTNFSVTNTPGPAATISATAGTPQSIAISTAFPTALSATVKDAGGNGVSGVTVTFTAPSSGASGTFAGATTTTTAVTNASGVATASVFTSNTTVGSYSVTATAPGVATPATFALTNLVGPPATISATGGTPQSAMPGAVFSSPFVALVKDAGGNPVSGVTVTFTPVAGPSGASGSFGGGLNTSVTNASGLATSTAFTANATPGTYQVNATAPGVATPAVFSLTNSAPMIGSIRAASGANQGTPINTQFGSVLVALVKDVNGNPVPGATVTFSLPASGPSASFAGSNVAITNGAGLAFSPALTANGTMGNFMATATVQNGPGTATFNLSNAAGMGSGPQITVTGGPVGVNLQTQLTITLPQASGSGVPVTITIMDESKLKPNGSNLNGFTVTIPAGATQTIVFVQGVSVGTSVVYASSPGYTTGMTTVSVTPSGFVLSGTNGVGGPFTTSAGGNTTLTVTSARLDSSGNFVEAQAVATGVTAIVPVTVSNSAGTIQSTPLTFTGGTQTQNTVFTAGGNSGSTVITAGVPAGFSNPAGGANMLSVTIQSGGLSLPNVSVGKNLETLSNVQLTGGAPEQNCTVGNFTGGLCVTVMSSDPSKVQFSTTPDGPGSPSIVLRVPTGLNHTQDFYVYGLADNGTVPYTASASGFQTATGTVTLTPSGAIIAGPFGIGSPSFTANVGTSSSNITVYTAQLNASGNFVGIQALRGGLTEMITVSSSNTSVGTISPATVTIPGGGYTGTTQFTPVGIGSTDLSVSVPADFNTPAPLYKTVTANVTKPKLAVFDAGIIGKNLQVSGTVQIAQNAPAGGVMVTLTSSNSGALLLSPAANVPGSPSITVTIPANTNNTTFYLQALSDTGTVAYTASATNYQDGTSSPMLAKSGVILSGPFGPNFGFPITTHVGSAPTNLAVQTAALNPDGTFIATQPLAAGQSLQVMLTTNPQGVGTVTSPVTISGGTDTATAQFTPTANGSTTVSVLTPAGYTPAPTTYTTVKFNVN